MEKQYITIAGGKIMKLFKVTTGTALIAAKDKKEADLVFAQIKKSSPQVHWEGFEIPTEVNSVADLPDTWALADRPEVISKYDLKNSRMGDQVVGHQNSLFPISWYLEKSIGLARVDKEVSLLEQDLVKIKAKLDELNKEREKFL